MNKPTETVKEYGQIAKASVADVSREGGYRVPVKHLYTGFPPCNVASVQNPHALQKRARQDISVRGKKIRTLYKSARGK